MTDPNGNPVYDVTVTIRPAADRLVTAQHGSSNAAGRIAFNPMGIGVYRITAVAPGFAPVQTVVVHDGNSDQTVALGIAHTVQGAILLDGADPADDAYLLFFPAGSDQATMVLADSDGAYARSNLEAGDYDVWIGSRSAVFQPLLVQNLQVAGAAPVILNATVTTGGATLSGTVTAVGQPIGAALVTLLDGDGRPFLNAMTSPDGNYTLNRLPAGPYTLRVSQDGYLAVTQPVLLPPNGLVEEDVALGIAQALPLTAVVNPTTRSHANQITSGSGGGNNLNNWINSGFETPQRVPLHENFVLPDLPSDAPFGQAQAYTDMVLMNSLANQTYRNWQTSHQNLHSLNMANMGLIASRSTIVVGKISAFIVTMNALTGGTVSAAGATAISGGYTAVSILSNIEQMLRVGNMDGVAAVMDMFNLALEQLSNETASRGIGVPLQMIDIGRELMVLLQDMEAANQDELAALSTATESRDQYRQAVERLREARRRFYDVAERKNKEGGGDTGEPEPGDPEEILGEQGPTRRDSFDPNAIYGPPGFGAGRWLIPNHRFDYTIQFENMITATAAAQQVIIVHQLDANLDWTTFTLGDIGFGDIYIAVPPGRVYYATRLAEFEGSQGFFVDVIAQFDPGSGQATWQLTAVDPTTGDLISDPEAGFLPPNVAAPAGEGFARYQVWPESNLATGSVIPAQATIFFDQNDPIETDVYQNTVDVMPPTSGVNPLPAESPAQFIVSWSGNDGVGSGIAFYDVYVAVDGGPFTLWRVEETAVSASFAGEIGRTYSFYSVATDNVGWRQPTPTAAQATTLIVSGYAIYLPFVRR